MKKETAAIFKTVVSLKTFRIFSKKKITGAATIAAINRATPT